MKPCEYSLDLICPLHKVTLVKRLTRVRGRAESNAALSWKRRANLRVFQKGQVLQSQMTIEMLYEFCRSRVFVRLLPVQKYQLKSI